MPLDLAPLRDAVAKLIAEGRVGTPSVVRWHLRSNSGSADRLASAAGEAASKWLGGKPVREHSVRSKEGETVVHATYASGAVSVITAHAGPGESANDLMLFGSRGAAYFGRTPEAGAA